MRDHMNKRRMKKGAALAVSLAAVSASLLFYGVSRERARASEPDETVSLGVSRLASPSLPQEGRGWSGDHVYFGTYGDKPMKWRVLDPTGEAGSSSAEGSILLQSDRIIDTMPFENGSEDGGQFGSGALARNQWNASGVRAWLRSEDGFFSDANFSRLEKKGIVRTTTEALESPAAGLKSVSLNRDTMFLLDVSDLANAAYGYSYEESAAGIDLKKPWWLRSAYTKLDAGVGCVLAGGQVFRDFVFEENGVVPACNLDPSSILFLTPADRAKSGEIEPVLTEEIHEWKLTLSEGRTLRTDEVERHSDEITVPYTYEGMDANQISVLITDGDYREEDASVTYYGKVSEDAFERAGTVTFTLPDEFDEESDQVYLMAEQVNTGNGTDYASEPAGLELPPPHEHVWEWRYDEEAHWQVCTAPDCDLEGEDAIEEYEEHDFGENEGVIIKEATEEEDGIEEILCDICENRIRVPFSFEGPDEPEETDEPEESDGPEEPEEPHEHEFVEVVVRPATCTETGIKRRYCEDEDCGESYEEVIPTLSATLSHTFGEWRQKTAPTTAQEGVSTRVCAVCGAAEIKKLPKLIPAHTHTYEENAWKSDLKYHWYQCACGETEDREAHEWNKGKILKKPTKKQEGEIEYRCTVCKKIVNRHMVKIGTKFTYGAYDYKIAAAGKGGTPTATLLGFARGKSSRIVKVPKTAVLNGVSYPVYKIADKAFASHKKIQKVVVGDNVEVIGNYSFFLAENVRSITLGSGVRVLGEHAFCHTYKLRSVMVYSKKLTEAATGLLHGDRQDLFIGVPSAREAKRYRQDVFYTHPNCVQSKKR